MSARKTRIVWKEFGEGVSGQQGVAELCEYVARAKDRVRIDARRCERLLDALHLKVWRISEYRSRTLFARLLDRCIC